MKLSMGYMLFTGVFTVLVVRNFFGPPMINDEDELYKEDQCPREFLRGATDPVLRGAADDHGCQDRPAVLRP